MTDWTKYSVVRDKVGDLWVSVADDLWSGYGDFPGDELESRFGPITPVLDAGGLPVVRTVGDLTMRHEGRRVWVDGFEGELVVLFDGIVTVEVLTDDDLSAPRRCTIDTPCEVLDD